MVLSTHTLVGSRPLVTTDSQLVSLAGSKALNQKIKQNQYGTLFKVKQTTNLQDKDFYIGNVLTEVAVFMNQV